MLCGLTDGQDSTLLLIRVIARHHFEYVVIELVEETSNLVSGGFSELTFYVETQFSGSFLTNVGAAGFQPRNELLHRKRGHF